MNGLRIPDTPIVVDCWKLRDFHSRSLFFLSHMHADHTDGLSEVWPHPIYCTPISAKLLVYKFKINPDLIVELEVGETKIIHFNHMDEHVAITVTTMDANHCPGSAMFLFEGYFGTILYTGDFRFSPSMMSRNMLSKDRSIDVLYLDNTYCDPQCQFPSREEASDSIVSLINSHPDKIVLIGLYTLGKEDLLVEIANRLQTWIGITEDRFEKLKLLEMPNVFKTSMEDCRVRVFPNYMIEKMLLSEMKDENYLAILPTCLYTGQGAPPIPSDNLNLKTVLYSDHSSYQELREFVKALKPKCVHPIVRNFTGNSRTITRLRTNMTVFDDLIDTTPPQVFSVPVAVQALFSIHATNSSSTRNPSSRPKLSSPHLIPTMKKNTSGSRTGSRPSPKGVQYCSPTKSSESLLSAKTQVLTPETNVPASLVDVAKKGSVCIIRSYPPNPSGDSDPLEVFLPSSQVAISYCNSKVCKPREGWVAVKDTSCARLVPFTEWKLLNKAKSHGDGHVKAGEGQGEAEVTADGSDKAPQVSAVISSSEVPPLTSESDCHKIQLIRGGIDCAPSPKKTKLSSTEVDMMTTESPPQEYFSSNSPLRQSTTVHPHVELATNSTHLEQTETDAVQEEMDINQLFPAIEESTGNGGTTNREDVQLVTSPESNSRLEQVQPDLGQVGDNLLKDTENQFAKVKLLLEQTDPNLYPYIAKLVSYKMGCESVKQRLKVPVFDFKSESDFPFKNIKWFASRFQRSESLIAECSARTGPAHSPPVPKKRRYEGGRFWGPEHHVSKETGICGCKDGRFCLLSSLRILNQLNS